MMQFSPNLLFTWSFSFILFQNNTLFSPTLKALKALSLTCEKEALGVFMMSFFPGYLAKGVQLNLGSFSKHKTCHNYLYHQVIWKQTDQKQYAPIDAGAY